MLGFYPFVCGGQNENLTKLKENTSTQDNNTSASDDKYEYAIAINETQICKNTKDEVHGKAGR